MNDKLNIAALSLIGNNTEYIRNKLNIHNCKEFIEYIAANNNCSYKEAIELIKNNNDLMKLMFSIA
jgi:hypothetical protein